MTKTPRTKKQLEQKIHELQVRLGRRQTKKISRLVNLRKRISAYQNQLSTLLSNASIDHGVTGDVVETTSSVSTNNE